MSAAEQRLKDPPAHSVRGGSVTAGGSETRASRSAWRGVLLRTLGCTLLLVVLAAIPISLPAGDDVTVPDSSNHVSVGFLTRTTVVVQQFLATGPTIRAVGIQFATYKRTNPGMVQVELEAAGPAGWQKLATTSLPTDRLQDNAFVPVPFPVPLHVAVGQPLRLTVKGDATNTTQAVTWWVNPEHQPAGYALTVNGVPQMGTARFNVQYYRTEGRLYEHAGEFFERVTPLLGGFWQGVLLAATVVVLAGVAVLLGRQVPD